MDKDEKQENLTLFTGKAARREYDEAFMERCKDLAVIGLYPPQIAERLGLQGRERENFLFDCENPLHPLHDLISTAYTHGQDDIDAALVTMAVSGDTDAIELAMKKRHEDKYLALREELFGF